MWWHAQRRLQPCHPSALSPASGFLDFVMTPGSGGEGGESAVAAAQVYYHLKRIHPQVTVLAPPVCGPYGGHRRTTTVQLTPAPLRAASRTLLTKELSLPQVNDCVALHLAVLHSLTLPLPKLPTFLFKTLAKFLQQLTGTRELSRSGNPPTVRDTDHLPDNLLISPPNSLLASTLFGSTSSVGSIPEPQTHLFKFVSDYRLVEEFEWLRSMFFRNMDRFPVTFCHNDLQENNLLVYKDAARKGFHRLLAIDFEYCSYNFRYFLYLIAFTSFFVDNNLLLTTNPASQSYYTTCNFRQFTLPHSAGLTRTLTPRVHNSSLVAVASIIHFRLEVRSSLKFWRKYLSVYNCVREKSIMFGAYAPGRRMHSASLSIQPSAVADFLKTSSSPDFTQAGTSSVNGKDIEKSLRFSELDEIASIPRVTLDPAAEDELIIETTLGALFSHIWWATWALIQSEISSIDFGFIDYAKSRMMAYYELKNTLPASELENFPGPVLPEVLSSPLSDVRLMIGNGDTITENHSAFFYVNHETDA
ncbi:unnamed protein product [Schistocephalus solidus]|uniref:Choline/ethanolamine kinase n=1 Tax=Schistocephalus solidus TaxID=70667 RepID=A0A183SIK5_SCHSO|nr:unnamed protein product [Schistocephalus solidus]